VSLRDIAGVLAHRAEHSGVTIAEPLAAQLVVYYQVLSHWNQKINLTSLSDPEEAVDRLLLEPLAAAAHVPHGVALIDLGSGGGSPAVPLALATGASRLVMVESRARKTAFLREVVRELGIVASVEARRFQELPSLLGFAGAFPLLSVRAVRLDLGLFSTMAGLLSARGVAALFRTIDAGELPVGLPESLRWISNNQLLPASRSSLTRLERST
jgi:16S rRNA (guanine527-N7)-methyltransferase